MRIPLLQPQSLLPTKSRTNRCQRGYTLKRTDVSSLYAQSPGTYTTAHSTAPSSLAHDLASSCRPLHPSLAEHNDHVDRTLATFAVLVLACGKTLQRIHRDSRTLQNSSNQAS